MATEDETESGAPVETESTDTPTEDTPDASVPDPGANDNDPVAMLSAMIVGLVANIAELTTLVKQASWDTLNGAPVDTGDIDASSDPDNSENDVGPEEITIESFFGTPEKDNN